MAAAMRLIEVISIVLGVYSVIVTGAITLGKVDEAGKEKQDTKIVLLWGVWLIFATVVFYAINVVITGMSE